MNREFCRQSVLYQVTQMLGIICLSGIMLFLTGGALNQSFLIMLSAGWTLIAAVAFLSCLLSWRNRFDLYSYFWRWREFQDTENFGILIPPDVKEAEAEVRRIFPKAESGVHYLGLDPIWEVSLDNERYYAAIWDENGHELTKMK